MNQNNSAQPGLTDDLKDAVDILRALRGYLKSHRINGPTMLCTDGKALNNADDEVLRALKLLVPLSKLRAPVADERAAELMEEARSEGHSSVAAYVDQLKTSAATYRQERNSARDAVARYRGESIARAALASAPVAGEAVAWMHEEDQNRVISAQQKAQAERDGGAYASSLRPYTIPLSRYAAPQASATDFAKLQSAYVAASDRIGELLAEKQASAENAPVAGEAVAHAVISYGRIQRLVVNEDSAHEYAEQQRLNAQAAGWDAKAHVRPLVYGDAAPQASEAVRMEDLKAIAREVVADSAAIRAEARNAALEEAAVIAETAPDYLQDSTFDGAARAIRALKTQASEAARDAGIEASVDQLVTAAKGMTKLYPRVWDRTDGSLVVFPENVARFDAAFDALRIAVGEAVDDDETAALSAQPAEKPATSAPSPAASQRQAMIPASRESGNSHTDGGAVYG